MLFDITRAREELGFEPQYGIDRAVEDYVEVVNRLARL